jgi:regulator of replication initiation timing
LKHFSRLRDPVHFFDARGKSVLSNDHLAAEVDRLTMENRELKRRLKATVTRLRAVMDESTKERSPEKAN